MFKKTYREILNSATEDKIKLDEAIRDNNSRDVILYRGRYLRALKQAQKLNPSGTVPSSLTGAGRDFPIDYVIHEELANHQAQIHANLNQVKSNPSVGEKIFGLKELSLNFRRLLTRISQKKFAENNTEREAASSEIGKDTLDLTVTPLKHAAWTAKKTLKYSIMGTAMVTSKLGPLAIKIVSVPFNFLNCLLVVIANASVGKSSSIDYNNTAVAQISDSLQDAVKTISDSIYTNASRF